MTLLALLLMTKASPHHWAQWSLSPAKSVTLPTPRLEMYRQDRAQVQRSMEICRIGRYCWRTLSQHVLDLGSVRQRRKRWSQPRGLNGLIKVCLWSKARVSSSLRRQDLSSQTPGTRRFKTHEWEQLLFQGWVVQQEFMARLHIKGLRIPLLERDWGNPW